MNIYELFLQNKVAVKISNEEDFKDFCSMCLLQLGLLRIRDFYKTTSGNQIGIVDIGLTWNKVCVTYKMGTGFNIVSEDSINNTSKWPVVMSYIVFKDLVLFSEDIKRQYQREISLAESISDSTKIRAYIVINKGTPDEKYIFSILSRGFGASKYLDSALRFRTKKALVNALNRLLNMEEFKFYSIEVVYEDGI